MGEGNRGHALGRGAPHLLLRSMTCPEGSVPIDFEYAPRPEYGLLKPLLSAVDGGVTARGGAEWLVLSSPVPFTLTDSIANAHFTMTAGQTYTFGTVKAAQARGDFQVLADRGRRALRVHLGADVAAGLRQLADLIGGAL